jgi:CRISPR-associated endonuclease/helicase Cas3
MKNLLAKDDGTLLLNHSKMVSDVAVMIYETTAKNYREDIKETIRIAGLLHDIGKCTNNFQKKLKDKIKNESTDNIEDDEKDCHPYKVRHNELGYVFLWNNFVHKNKKEILDPVYWHHGVSPDNFDSKGFYKNDISIIEKDIEHMKEFLMSVLGDGYLMNEPTYKIKFSRPEYFSETSDLNDEINENRLLIRNCIISADRIVSMGSCENLTTDEIKTFIKNYNVIDTTIDINNHIYNTTNSKRYQKQIEISSSIINDVNKTHIIKAPAGFGKTLTGMLWSFQRNKRLIWVCPRNDVAKSVYKSILNELDGFENGSSISVELFLTGEVKEQQNQNNNTKGFDSDIIVTNIDNFLNPTVDNRYSHRMFTIMESDVIFDEYHELVSDNALFSLFIIMMKIRHQKTNSSTILLSATPNVMEQLWDNTDNVTSIFPSKDSHYSPQHNEKYTLNVVDQFIPKDDNSYSNVTIVNSISNSQIIKRNNNVPFLYHSNFVKDDRNRIISEIFVNYDKNSNRVNTKPNVVSTHILQASLDISFNHLMESVLSPESTLQRIGRCNRFGDYDSPSTITIFKDLPNNQLGEVKMRDILYREDLSNMWFDCLKKFNGQELTLEDFYKIYNEFINKNRIKLLEPFIENKFEVGLSKLSQIFPIKFFSNVKKSKVNTAGVNKLRNSGGNEIFVITNYYNDTNKYSDPICVDTYGDIGKSFNEPPNVLGRLIKVFKHLKNDGRFDYDKIISSDKRGNLTLDHIRKHGKKDNTPYIRFNKVYHPEYGFVSPKIIF